MAPTALLVVDVSEGRARIPGLAVYGNQADYGSRVYDQIATFFGDGLTLDRHRQAYYTLAQTFLGSFGDPKRGGMQLDSRWVDYLDIVANSGAGNPNAQNLLHYVQNPIFRARLISELTSGTFRSLYWTNYSIIDPSLLASIAQAIIRRGVKIVGPEQQNMAVVMPFMTDLMQGYVSNTFNTTTPRGGTFGNYTPLYSV